MLYFSNGGSLYKYDPNAASGAGAFGQNIIPSPYLTALYPIWANGRLIYVWKNTLVISDILNPEAWNTTTQTLKLDPVESDFISGLCLWQNQAIAVFRNGSTWIIETGPGLMVVNWEINRASATVGCCCCGTIVQCGTDVYFLSETGRGVYALSQMPMVTTSGQSQGVVWQPISAPIKRYIDRINWAAVACARATYWNDLYLLSVPLDNSSVNNFILIYSVSLSTWQGIWCLDMSGTDIAPRDFARDRTNINQTYLAIGTIDGMISQFSYPIDRRYYDQDINGVQHPVESSLMSRGFTFGEDVNQIQPHGALLQFIESSEDVDITIWMDRLIEGPTRTINTNTFLLSLPIPSFPFDLDGEGYKNQSLSLLGLGLCSELQLELQGDGNWTLYQLKTTAFEAMPLALA